MKASFDPDRIAHALAGDDEDAAYWRMLKGQQQPEGFAPSEAEVATGNEFAPPTNKASMRSYTPSWAERIKGGVSDAMHWLGADRYVANNLGDKVTGAAQFFPPTGVLLAKNEMDRSAERGEAGGTALAALGALPAAGPGLKAGAVVGRQFLAKGAENGVAAKIADALAPMDVAKNVKSARAPGEPMFPQYAEAYPPVGPPQLMDKKTLKPIHGVEGEAAQAMVDATPQQAYWGKVLTPEAKAFQKERSRIMKDMKTNGYEPYFDPAKREHVDPAYYPQKFDTAVDALPKRQETIDRHKAILDTPEGRKRLWAAYEEGLTLKNANDWYAMKQLETGFRQEYGDVLGRHEFKKRFADSMAATTGGSNPESNFLMSHYVNYLDKKGLPAPEANQLPFPIGGRYAAGNIEQGTKMLNRYPPPPQGMMGHNGGPPLEIAEGFNAGNPKRYDFSGAYTGGRHNFTVDEQMTGLLVPGMPMPSNYGVATGIGREEALRGGVDPRAFQDIGWAGAKKIKTEAAGKKFVYEGPMIDRVNDSIERTHRLTGMPKDEIFWRGIVRQEIPVYGLAAGAVFAPALVDDLRKQHDNDSGS